MKTCTELEKEWGKERYVKALGHITGLINKHGYYIQDITVLEKLSKEDNDGFLVYSSRVFYGDDKKERV